MVKRTVTTMREQVYQILRDEICAGFYSPGYRLQELELTEHLNVSRSPVREALRQLASDGLVVEIPNKGVYVKAFTVKDIEEIFDLRVMLEGYGIEKGAVKMTSARIKKLLELMERMESAYVNADLRTYTELDEQLHTEIVSLAGNDLVDDTYERVRSMNQQFRVLSLSSAKRFEESMEEHRSMIQALLTGDIQTALETNRSHLRLARKTIIERMEQQKGAGKATADNGKTETSL